MNRSIGEIVIQHPKIDSIHTIHQILKIYPKQFNQSGTFEKIIPRKFNSQRCLESLVNNLHYRKTNSHLSSLTKSLSEPIYDILDRGGKRWRPILCMLIAEMYGHKRQEVYDIAGLCQIIHNGTLIVDDIEDSSIVRRDKECVHLIYGIDISVNASNFMYFAPLNYLLKSGKLTASQHIKLAQVYAEEMTALHIGQGWDILWHNLHKLKENYPTEHDYLQMTAHKTGVLARLATRLVCIYLELEDKQCQAIARYAETLGVAYQIEDDLLNIAGEEYTKTKGYSGQDIHEGKITLMVIYFLNSDAHKEQKDRLKEILNSKTTDQIQIQEAITLLKSQGTLDKARNKMYELVDEAWKQVQIHLPNNMTKQLLKELGEYGIKRDK